MPVSSAATLVTSQNPTPHDAASTATSAVPFGLYIAKKMVRDRMERLDSSKLSQLSFPNLMSLPWKKPATATFPSIVTVTACAWNKP